MAVTLWRWLVTASDRLELSIIAVRIVRLKAVSVRLLVIQTEAHRGVLPVFAVGPMLIMMTLVSLLTKTFTVARVMPIGCRKTDKT